MPFPSRRYSRLGQASEPLLDRCVGQPPCQSSFFQPFERCARTADNRRRNAVPLHEGVPYEQNGRDFGWHTSAPYPSTFRSRSAIRTIRHPLCCSARLPERLVRFPGRPALCPQLQFDQNHPPGLRSSVLNRLTRQIGLGRLAALKVRSCDRSPRHYLDSPSMRNSRSGPNLTPGPIVSRCSDDCQEKAPPFERGRFTMAPPKGRSSHLGTPRWELLLGHRIVMSRLNPRAGPNNAHLREGDPWCEPRGRLRPACRKPDQRPRVSGARKCWATIFGAGSRAQARARTARSPSLTRP